MKKKDDEIDEEVDDEVVMRARDARLNLLEVSIERVI